MSRLESLFFTMLGSNNISTVIEIAFITIAAVFIAYSFVTRYTKYVRSSTSNELYRVISEYKKTIENLSDEKMSIQDRIAASEEKAKIDFEKNLKSSFRLINFKTTDLSFFSDFEWEFQPQVNILLGKNGYGKSHLLRSIVGLLQDDKKALDVFVPSDIDPELKLPFTRPKITLSFTRDDVAYEIYAKRKRVRNKIGKIPVLAIPDSRLINKASSTIQLPEEKLGKINEFGAYHFLNDATYGGRIQKFLYDICISHLDRNKSLDLPILSLITRIVQKLSDANFEFYKITAIEGEAQFKIEVKTEGNENYPIPLQKASQGTLSILTMFGIIYSFIKSVWPHAKDNEIFLKPAIVFIDEIDAHLHPTWEQKIVTLFRETFPNIQFFMTAHSPLVASGCFQKEVSILRKGNSGFYLEQIPNHLIGANTIDLYLQLFEIKDVDENYKNLLNKKIAGEKNSDRINQLERKTILNDKERLELSHLYRENRLLSQFKDIKKQKYEQDYKKKVGFLESKIRKLERQLELNLK